jgi:hypothetical protein
VDNSGTPLADGALDSHYALGINPEGIVAGNPATVLTSTGAFPIPPWVGDGPLSAWIGLRNPDLAGAPGLYDYQTSFDLTGFDETTAILTGNWGADDSATISLNGVDTGQSVIGFAALQGFTISTGFHAGENTLDFIVTNGPNPETGTNPTGLRVEFTEATTATPEPASFVLFGLGLAGLGLWRNRRSAV